RRGGSFPLADHPEGACRDAVAAAVADVVLDHDSAELGAEDRPRRADVEAAGVGAVLAHVGLHQPAEVLLALLDRVRRLLLDAGDLAGFAADADRRVGEEAEPRLRLCLVGLDAVARLHASSPTVRG